MVLKIKRITITFLIVSIFLIIINFVSITYIGYINGNYTLENINSKLFLYYKKVFWIDKEKFSIKQKSFIQKKDYSCGPAAVRYVLNYYGIDVTEERLINIISTDKIGSNLDNMVKAFNHFGLNGIGIKANYQKLKEFERPVIAYIKNDHFVVIRYIKNDYVYLFDPSPNWGKIKIKANNFLKLWDGVLLIIKTKPIS